MIESKIKDIVSVFLKTTSDQITGATVIDRSATGSSIVLHRMYAKLASEGIVVDNYWNIKKFADLLTASSARAEVSALPVSTTVPIYPADLPAASNLETSVGIDIEDVASFIKVDDFREEPFYKMNFSEAEIAYCILQADPYISFAGLFAAKEAIIKADNSYRDKAFNTLEIGHLVNGKPFHRLFNLSISHTPALAVAVAIPDTSGLPSETTIASADNFHGAKKTSGQMLIFWMCLISVLLSVIAIMRTLAD